MQTKIKFVASGANSAIGGFSPGDTARIDAAMAAHLVDAAKVAVYVGGDTDAPKDAGAQTEAKPETKPATKAKKK